MGKRHEAAALLRQGLSPEQIASRQQVGLSTILQYLDQMVGAGEIRRSDILFSVRSDVRHAVLDLIKQDPRLIRTPWKIPAKLKDSGIDATAGDVEVVVRYRDEQIAFGDMYEDLRAVEVGIHRLVRSTLEEEFGREESGWWRAIPQAIRAKCAARREEDEDPGEHPYGFTDLLDISKIIEKNWEVISRKLPKEAAQNRKVLLEGFTQLNRLRRTVMHPVRGGTPTETDFAFLREFKVKFGFADARPVSSPVSEAKSNDDLLELLNELQRIAGQGRSDAT